MATTKTTQLSDYGSDVDLHTAPTSEYGSDFDVEEETLIGDLLSHLAATAPTGRTIVYENVERGGEGENDQEPEVLVHQLSPPAIIRVQKGAKVELAGHLQRSASDEVEYDGPSSRAWSLPRDLSNVERLTASDFSPAIEGQSVDLDTRSPLERFRTKPKKPLSVTDLVSPAWCELQYWYSLMKFGRKPRTQAMRQGSKVHRELEEQVYEIVPVQIQSKEDRFGLKIWNVIQGLRTLRETGLTRELEIWGIIDGQVVNGVIDELSYTCPDREFEEKIERSKLERSGGTLPLGQLSIERSFANAKAGNQAEAWHGALKPEHIVYLADVKTRGTKSMPTSAARGPTEMQLMLYRKLLESLALNTVDAETVFARYGVQPLEPFTETFISELSEIDGITPDKENSFATLQASEISLHPNLFALWSLMISELQLAVNNVSSILRAEFRHSKTSELIGSEVFAYEEDRLEKYVDKEMSWWKGERKAKGVEIEEAFKCRTCEFAEDCEWRRRKIEEATEKARLRVQKRSESSV